MERVPHWTSEQKQQFLNQQFLAQHNYYQQMFPAADYLIVLYEGQSAGRIYLNHQPHEISLIEITLLPELRNRGIGEHIIRNILDQAARENKTVGIYVEHFNPALRLYQRLGFQVIREVNSIYLQMEWKAGAAALK